MQRQGREAGREKVSIRLLIAKTDNVSLWTFNTASIERTHMHTHTHMLQGVDGDRDKERETEGVMSRKICIHQQLENLCHVTHDKTQFYQCVFTLL